jgi:proteasome lid subunit RPN8/RPN11
MKKPRERRFAEACDGTMPSFIHLHIPDSLLAELIAHARSTFPNECCGLLAGRMKNEIGIASTRFPITNDLASPTSYLTNARDLFDAFRAMRESGEELLAVYHSHPASPPVPSRRDLEENTYGETVIHLIVGLGGAEPKVRAWRLGAEDYRETEWFVA